jgi:hydrogenase maturation protein HypF
MNRYLLTHTLPALRSAGFTVLQNRDLPANDGCISYGQAAVATAQLAQLAARGIHLT